MSVTHPLTIHAVDSYTGKKLNISSFLVNGSGDDSNVSSGDGHTQIYSGHPLSVSVSAAGYADAYWSGSSDVSEIYVEMMPVQQQEMPSAEMPPVALDGVPATVEWISGAAKKKKNWLIGIVVLAFLYLLFGRR